MAASRPTARSSATQPARFEATVAPGQVRTLQHADDHVLLRAQARELLSQGDQPPFERGRRPSRGPSSIRRISARGTPALR